MTNEILRKLCIKNNWYTRGTNKEYAELFQMNSNGATYEELAMNIFWNSTAEDSTKAGLVEIETELKKEDMPEINIIKLMDTLRRDGWTLKQIEAIYLGLHGSKDNGKIYITT